MFNKWYSNSLNSFLIFLYKHKKVTLLSIYHICFIFFAFYYRTKRGISDAHYYWAMNFDISNHSWFEFANYGTKLILFINYPFIKLGLPFWFGFLLYGFIGFLGILKWIKWTFFVFGDNFYIKNTNVLWVVFYFPNLHFWTASLGKEPLIFWGLANLFYAFSTKKYFTFSSVIGALIVILIRPHVAFVFFLSCLLIFLFNNKIKIKIKLWGLLFVFPFFSVLVLMMFRLSKINFFDVNRIVYYNNFSILSFKNSGSYVPMLDYSFSYKLFSFYFRPLFFDNGTLFVKLSSFENNLFLILVIAAIYFLLKFKKKIKLTIWFYFSILFTLLLAIMYVNRYANFGIFMRTKMMYFPFLIVALIYIIKEGCYICKKKIHE